MRTSQIIFCSMLLAFWGCNSKVEKGNNPEQKVVLIEDTASTIDIVSSGLFKQEKQRISSLYFSMCKYIDDSGLRCKGDNVYYELSEPHYCSNTSIACYRYVCGKLYSEYKIREKNGIEHTKCLRMDSTLSFIDLEGNIWETYYVSDTTDLYGYFYVQMFGLLGNGSKNHMINFGHRVRIVSGLKGEEKFIPHLEGFYERIGNPFRRLTEKDIKEETNTNLR